jgi:hypothetical protein
VRCTWTDADKSASGGDGGGVNCAGVLASCANPTCSVVVQFMRGVSSYCCAACLNVHAARRQQLPLPVERHTPACLKFQEEVRAEYDRHYGRKEVTP